MEVQKVSIEKLVFKSGIWICLAYIVYFMLMKVTGFIYIPELRALNFIIQLFGVVFTLRAYRRETGKSIPYLPGLSIGFFTSAVSVVLFSVFVYLYFFFDPELLIRLKADAPVMGRYLTQFSAGISVLSEGLISGLIVSFALMQYYKDDSVHSPYRQGPGPEDA